MSVDVKMGHVRGRQRWPLLLATVPLWPIVWLMVFASSARVKLGFWPGYDHPDPSDLHWAFLDIPVLPLLLFAPVALLVSLILACRKWFVGRRDWSIFLLTVGSFVVLLLWLKIDPAGLFEWWMD